VYLKPCAKCKSNRQGVSYCIRMGHTPLGEEAEGEDVSEHAGSTGKVICSVDSGKHTVAFLDREERR